MPRLTLKILIATVAACSASGGLYAQSKSGAAKPAAAETYAASTEWPTYGHDAGGMRHSPLTEITPANVSNLEIAWAYHLKPDGYVAAGGGRGDGRGGGRGAGTSFQQSQATPLV